MIGPIPIPNSGENITTDEVHFTKRYLDSMERYLEENFVVKIRDLYNTVNAIDIQTNFLLLYTVQMQFLNRNTPTTMSTESRVCQALNLLLKSNIKDLNSFHKLIRSWIHNDYHLLDENDDRFIVRTMMSRVAYWIKTLDIILEMLFQRAEDILTRLSSLEDQMTHFLNGVAPEEPRTVP